MELVKTYEDSLNVEEINQADEFPPLHFFHPHGKTLLKRDLNFVKLTQKVKRRGGLKRNRVLQHVAKFLATRIVGYLVFAFSLIDSIGRYHGSVYKRARNEISSSRTNFTKLLLVEIVAESCFVLFRCVLLWTNIKIKVFSYCVVAIGRGVLRDWFFSFKPVR